jgi:uncharacterized coiled-coil DUF342 family protein
LILNAELTDISNDIKERIVLARLILLTDEGRDQLASLQVKRMEVQAEFKLLRTKKPKVNPMADELLASFASIVCSRHLL